MAWIENLGDIFYDVTSNEFQWKFPNLYYNLFEAEVESPSSSDAPPNIASPRFCFEGEKFRWGLMPSGVLLDASFGLFLWQNPLNSKKKRFQLDICLRTPSRSLQKIFLTNPNEDTGTWNFYNLDIFSNANSVSPQGLVTFSWKMSSLPESESPVDIGAHESRASLAEGSSTEAEQNTMTGPKGVERLLQSFENLLKEGQNSDVILKVEGSEFAVHRCVLAARSPVFESMFQHDMAERNSDAIDIPDCTSEAFRLFLQYLYTGSTSGPISAETVPNLYYAADKYQVYDLKEDCVELMKKSLSEDNFCDVISLAWRHCESGLLAFAIHFFRDNLRKIMKTVQWQRYSQQNPQQANELLTKVLNLILD